MKELVLKIRGVFDDETADRLRREVEQALTHVDRTAMEKDVVHGFTTLARQPRIESAETFDV